MRAVSLLHTARAFARPIGGRQGFTCAPPPAALTALLTGAPTVETLLRLHERHVTAFNEVHISAFWSTLGKLTRQNRRQASWLHDNSEALRPAREHTSNMMPALGPRELAQTAHGAASAHVGSAPPWASWWGRLAASTLPVMDQLTHHELNISAYAFARSRASVPAFFDGVSWQVAQRLESLQPPQLALLAWSFSAAQHPAPTLMAALAATATPRIADFSAEQVSMLTSAFVRTETQAHDFFAALEAELPDRLRAFRPRELSHTVLTLARAGHSSPVLYEALAVESIKRLGSFRAVDLAALASGFAQAAAPHRILIAPHRILIAFCIAF